MTHQSAISYPKVTDTRYRVWAAMKTRCLNKNSDAYKDYGGRGVTICDRWINSFESFALDMGPRPSMKHSIERVNNDGNYCPENCIWATMRVQGLNRRNTKFVVINGKRIHRKIAERKYGVPERTARSRLDRGWSAEEAFGLVGRPTVVKSGVPKWGSPLFVNRTGQRYGCFILKQVSAKSTSRHTYWDAVCDCGKSKQIRTDHLKRYASSPRDCEGRSVTGRASSSRALPVAHSERI